MRPRAEVPEWLLERLAAGELPPSRATELRAALAEQGDERRLAAIAESNAQILADLPAPRVVAEVERRAAARKAPSRRARPFVALSLAATCAAGLAVYVALRGEDRPECIDGICLKGGVKPSLNIHRQTKNGPEKLADGAVVRKGDALHIRYLAAGRRFGVVASIDARSTVTLHLPEVAGPAVPLERNGERALPHSYELDDSPGFERFVFVTADRSFTTEDVASALKHGGGPPSGLTMYELTLKKEAP